MRRERALLPRDEFRETYRTVRVRDSFLVELDDLVDRYRLICPTSVPWDSIYEAANELYFQHLKPAIRNAAFYALTNTSDVQVLPIGRSATSRNLVKQVKRKK